MHYRLLDIQRQKVNNPLKVRSVITMCYNANKEIQKKLFKTVVSFSEEQVEAFKTIFEKGDIIKEEDVHGAYRGIKVFENKLIIKEIAMWGDDTTVTLHEYNLHEVPGLRIVINQVCYGIYKSYNILLVEDQQFLYRIKHKIPFIYIKQSIFLP